MAAEIDGAVERLQEAAELIRAGDPERARRLAGASARASRSLLLEATAGDGQLTELQRRRREPARHGRRDRPRARRAGVNIEDMALFPATEATTGAISLWIAGESEASAPRRSSPGSVTPSS